MKRLLSIALISVGLGTFASADTFNLHQGWNLVGSSSSVDLSKDFNNSNISVVWRYENGQWQYYASSEAIKTQIGNKYTLFTKTSPNEGFWVYAYNPLSINIGNNNQQNSINSNTCNVDFSKVQNLEEPGSIDDINLDELNGKIFDNVDLSKDIFVKNAFVNLTCIKWVFESENGVYSFDGNGHVVIKSSSGSEMGTYKIVDLGDNKNILIIEVGNEEHVYVPMWKDESNNGYIGFLFDVKDGNISNINKTKFVPLNNENDDENDNNSNNYQNNENDDVNVDLNSYQDVISVIDNGYKYTDAMSLIGGNQYLQLDKTNSEINVSVLKPFKAKEIYTKGTFLSYKDLTTGETLNGYEEYYYPEGKVHYDLNSSKYGHADCTAYYDVSNLDKYITPGDDISKYYNFDDQKNLKDKGNCPDWILSDDDDNDSEIYKVQEDTTITDTNNTQIKIKEYESLTK